MGKSRILDLQVPPDPRRVGGAKGHNTKEISYPGRAALGLPAVGRVGRGGELHDDERC